MFHEIEKVAEFHRSFSVNISNKPCIPMERKDLRLNLIYEEYCELNQAIDNNDLVETFDALLDLQYVLFGTVLEFGLQDYFSAGFDEVHRSNMTKLDSTGSPKYRKDGKVIKSDMYIKPDLISILSR